MDMPLRPVGVAAKARTCLVPEKLEFACFAFKPRSRIHAAASQMGPPMGVPHGCVPFSPSCLKEEPVTHVSGLHVSLGCEEWSEMTQIQVSLLEPSPGGELGPIISACVSMVVWICHTFKHGKKGKGKGREGKGREGKGREGKGREGKGREGKGREGKGREGKGREGKGREGKGRETKINQNKPK